MAYPFNLIARQEGVSVSFLKTGLLRGTIVIPLNRRRRITRPCAIGQGLKTKVNINLGTSKDCSNASLELRKLKAALSGGTDTVMDLSTGGDLAAIRRKILQRSNVPLGTVPIYETALSAIRRYGKVERMDSGAMMETLRRQAGQGVDFFTIHAGITRLSVEKLLEHKRLMGVVSRGGAFLIAWMRANRRENPLYEYFDDVLAIARKHNVTLSLGDGMRPGSILDSTDEPQVQELMILGELQKRALEKGVQVMIEGPGHIRIDQVESNVILEKSICNNAPFYILGPLVTDVAAGYDHISAAIGSAMAAAKGADFLCAVTPSEHLALPNVADIEDGLYASRIAAHAADIAKGLRGALDWDQRLSVARRRRDWRSQIKLSIHPQRARSIHGRSSRKNKDFCSMCSDLCSLKIMEGLG